MNSLSTENKTKFKNLLLTLKNKDYFVFQNAYYILKTQPIYHELCKKDKHELNEYLSSLLRAVELKLLEGIQKSSLNFHDDFEAKDTGKGRCSIEGFSSYHITQLGEDLLQWEPEEDSLKNQTIKSFKKDAPQKISDLAWSAIKYVLTFLLGLVVGWFSKS